MNFSENILMKALIEASWQSALIILLILLIRPLLGMRVPARWRYLLWMLVIVRLLVPAFVLPPSPASLQNIAVVDRPFEQLNLTFNSADDFKPMPQSLEEQAPANLAATSPAVSVPIVLPKPAVKSYSWWRIAAIVWVSGAVLVALWILSETLLLLRQLRRDSQPADAAIQSVWVECCAKASLRRPLSMIATRCVESPALLGLFRPVLLIPKYAMQTFSTDDWRHVFMHELAHHKRRDHLTQALQLLALCVHWFNPMVWFGFRYLRADRELAADEWALEKLKEADGTAYGDTLLKVLSSQVKRSIGPCMIGIVEDASQLKRRLKHIVAFGPYKWISSIVGVFTLLIFSAVVLGRQSDKASPAKEAAKPAVAADTLESLSQEMLAAARKSDGKQILLIFKKFSDLAQIQIINGFEASPLLNQLLAENDLKAFTTLLDELHKTNLGNAKDWQIDDAGLSRLVSESRKDFLDALLDRRLNLDRLSAAGKSAAAPMSGWITQRVSEVRKERADIDALVKASGDDDLDTMRRLLDAGVDINGVSTDPDHWTPLTKAAASNKLAAVELLLERGAEVDKPKHPGWDYTPLCLTRMVPIAEALKKKGANVHAKLFKRDVSILTYVTRWGGGKLTRWFLEQGLDPKMLADNKKTLLFGAGDPLVAELLLKAGVDPNQEDEYGNVPLCEAVSGEVAQKLIDYGAKVKGLKEPLIPQMVYGYAKGSAIEVVLKAGAEQTPEILSRALQGAAHVDADEVARVLLQYGAKPNEEAVWSADGKHKSYPLLTCTVHGSPKTAKVLLEYGADPNAGLPGQFLKTAMSNGHKDVAEILRSAGAKGVSDLAYFIAIQNKDKVKELLSSIPAYADNPEFWQGALCAAARRGDLETVIATLEKGVPLLVTKEEDPFREAAFEGHHEVLTELLKRRDAKADPMELRQALWGAVWNSYPYSEQRPAEAFEKCVALLLDAKTPVGDAPKALIRDNLMIAAVFSRNPGGNPKVIEMLVAAGADPNPILEDKKRLSDAIQESCSQGYCSAPFEKTVTTIEKLAKVSINRTKK